MGSRVDGWGAHDCNLAHEFLALLLEDGGRGGASGAEVECHVWPLPLSTLLLMILTLCKKGIRYTYEYIPYAVEWLITLQG